MQNSTVSMKRTRVTHRWENRRTAQPRCNGRVVSWGNRRHGIPCTNYFQVALTSKRAQIECSQFQTQTVPFTLQRQQIHWSNYQLSAGEIPSGLASVTAVYFSSCWYDVSRAISALYSKMGSKHEKSNHANAI